MRTRLACRTLPMRPRRPRRPVIQQKMPNVASSLPDAPDRDLYEPRDQRCRWGLKPSARSGPEKRKERTVSRIVAFGVGVGRNHHAQGLRCHSSEPAEKRKVSPCGRCVLLSRAVPGFCKKKWFVFSIFKKMFSSGCFVLFCFVLFLCLCLCLCLCFCVFLASRRRAFLGPDREARKKARRMGGGPLRGPEKNEGLKGKEKAWRQ